MRGRGSVAAVAACLLLIATTAGIHAADDPLAPAAVSGSIQCQVTVFGSAPTGSPPPYGIVDQQFSCTHQMSDPRVSGASVDTLTVLAWLPTEAKNGIGWHRSVLTGPDGTWEGVGFTLYDDAGDQHLTTYYAGTGAYEGLIYAWTSSGFAGATMEAVGVIQPGTLPPILESHTAG